MTTVTLLCKHTIFIQELMTEGSEIMEVETFTIQNESEADSYLTDLLENPKYRSMDEVELRATQYIKDADIRNYFMSKAREMLNA